MFFARQLLCYLSISETQSVPLRFGEECQTDEYGASKHHYCAEKGSTGCITDQAPPKDPVCDKFFADPNTPKNISDKSHEIHVIDEQGAYHTCYHTNSPKRGSEGWCKVNQGAATIAKMSETASWGFCGSDCYLNKKEEASSVRRKKEGVDVLDETLCDNFLEASSKELKENNQNSNKNFTIYSKDCFFR